MGACEHEHHPICPVVKTKSNSVDGLMEALQAQTDVDVARRDVIDACKRLQVEKKAVFNPRMLTIKVRWRLRVMRPRNVGPIGQFPCVAGCMIEVMDAQMLLAAPRTITEVKTNNSVIMFREFKPFAAFIVSRYRIFK